MNPLLLKLIIGGVIVAGIAAMGYRLNEWRVAYGLLPEVEKALKAEETCAEGSKCAKRKADFDARVVVIQADAVKDFTDEIASLANRPPRVIRVCNERDVQRPGPSAGVDEGTSAPGLVQTENGRDIGPGTYKLLDQCDELSAQLRAILQERRGLQASVEVSRQAQ